MQILINPTEVELKTIEANPLIGYVPLTFLEARDKNNRLLAILTVESNIDGAYLLMNSFGIRYRLALTSNVEDCLELLLNQANLTSRRLQDII